MALDDAEREELHTLRAERAIHRVMLAYARGVDTCDFEIDGILKLFCACCFFC